MDDHAENDENLSRTPLWTLEELCTKLRATPRTVHGWRRRGTGPAAHRIGRHLMFDEADVRDWLKARRTTSAADDEPTGTPAPTTGRGGDRDRHRTQARTARQDLRRGAQGSTECRGLLHLHPRGQRGLPSEEHGDDILDVRLGLVLTRAQFVRMAGAVAQVKRPL
ncbi:helix-turn-helix transcriptional regulator [Promicromonospora sp. NPDC057488]|uniref:helix-turn-helix transcriptional regulator n=1 Tax=Promicromonospora sp. NPDC057488 TaxID=3346147 RepID=UPI00366FDBE8